MRLASFFHRGRWLINIALIALICVTASFTQKTTLTPTTTTTTTIFNTTLTKMAEKIVAVTDGTDDGLRSKKDNFFPLIFASKSVFKSFIQALLACSVFISFVSAMICMVKCKCNRCKKVSALICYMKRECNRCKKMNALICMVQQMQKARKTLLVTVSAQVSIKEYIRNLRNWDFSFWSCVPLWTHSRNLFLRP